MDAKDVKIAVVVGAGVLDTDRRDIPKSLDNKSSAKSRGRRGYDRQQGEICIGDWSFKWNRL